MGEESSWNLRHDILLPRRLLNTQVRLVAPLLPILSLLSFRSTITEPVLNLLQELSDSISKTMRTSELDNTQPAAQGYHQPAFQEVYTYRCHREHERDCTPHRSEV